MIDEQNLDGLVRSIRDIAQKLDTIQVSVLRLNAIASALEALSVENRLKKEPFGTSQPPNSE